MMERTITSRIFFTGKIVRLRVDQVELEDGREAEREVVEHRGAVTILPIKGDSILFVRQYRKAVEEEVLELPAGTREEEEEVEDTARRELLEETGYRAGSLRYLSSFYTSPGYSSEEIHLFLALDLKEDFGEDASDEDEDLEIIPLKKERVLELLHKGSFKDAKTIAGLSLYFLKEGSSYERD